MLQSREKKKKKYLLSACLVLFWLVASVSAARAVNPDTIALKVEFGRTEEGLVAAIHLGIPGGFYLYEYGAGEGLPTRLLLPEALKKNQVWYPGSPDKKYVGETVIFVNLPAPAAGGGGRNTAGSGKMTRGAGNSVTGAAGTPHVPGGYAGQAAEHTGSPVAGSAAGASDSAGRTVEGSGNSASRTVEGTGNSVTGAAGVAGGGRFRGGVRGLLCSDARCVPQKVDFDVPLPSAAAPVAEMPWAAAWRNRGTPVVAGVLPDPGPVSAKGKILPQPAEDSALARELQDILNGNTAGPEELEPQYAAVDLEVNHWGKALFLGFLAGLLLNAMPCVLPVLTLKVSGMLMNAGEDLEARRVRFREHNLFFAAGIMTWFVVLALVLGLAGAIWGQLFQSPVIVLGMLFLVFMLGLSMLGVFTLPMIDLKSGGSGNPRVQAYSTGVLATLLATPCSGPLLGGVLSWAFTQPVVTTVVVFCAVGAGMASPYIVFAYKPGLVRLMPAPGAWMHVLEKIMGFFLLGTSLYLLSILPRDCHIQVLTALLVLALFCWVWGSFCGYNAPPRRRFWVRISGIVLLGCMIAWAARPAGSGVEWESFSPRTLPELAGKAPLLMEFTAGWCPNCKFLEATVLRGERLRILKEKYGIRLVRVDLTENNEAGQELLERLGSKSIPLTALFPAGEGWRKPVVLRDVYTAAALEEAARTAFAPGVSGP